MSKKVILCFNRDEEIELKSYIQRMRVIHEEKGFDAEDLQVEIIYPCDISANQYMTWTGTNPSEQDKAILSSLTPEDKIYIWGHGAPNYAYIPGAVYTEIADYLEKGIDKSNFGPGKGTLNITVEICSGARGGKYGKDSFAARLHSLLGKKGIESTVTGRMKNVAFDPMLLPIEGIKTIDRAYDGMVKAGIYESESFYQHMAERSKVTYKWDDSHPNMQVRVDSYRRSTMVGFLILKRKILERLRSIDLSNYSELHRTLLTIELNLAQHDRRLNTKLLKKYTEKLEEICKSKGLTDNELKDFGFNYFASSIGKKATENGFLIQKTGLFKNDELLEIERESFYEFINSHPLFFELNRLADIISTLNYPELGMTIGSKGTCDGENIYALFFLLARRHNLIKNDGHLIIPSYIEESMELLNKMLRLSFESELPVEKRILRMSKLKQQMIFFKHSNYRFENINALQGSTPIKEDVIYFEIVSNSIFRYKVKIGEEVFADEINLNRFPEFSKNKTHFLSKQALNVNQIKQPLLDALSQRGHTKIELAFWGKLWIMLSTIYQETQKVFDEHHEASHLEFIGNIFCQPYKAVKAELQNQTHFATLFHKVIVACEMHLNSTSKKQCNPFDQSVRPK
ncbi:hypothetical protein [Fluoribacter gormanii]|uniref:hypothetical protein n=1 Tax=Fluoribacter gormanii TaxID=464 RepID=UPI001040E336|nr:hypothetical protein [Fluoribacter gormanii]